MIDLSIIIVNYNVKEFLQNLLNSIQRSIKHISAEVIVIDNASDDGSVEIIRDKFPYVKLIASPVNLGFGKANNLGMEIAQGKFFLLLNPDTIVQEDTFNILLDFFKQTPDAGLAGCKVLNSDGTLQLACRRSFPGPWTSFTKVTGLSTLFPKSRLFARYNLTYLDENKTYEVDAISGAFMMMKREVYDKIGGFDPQFFMYGEDLDLCYRTQKAGYKVYYVHTTQIIHYKGESTRRSSMDETKVFYDAMHLFVRKHFSSSYIVEIILQLAIVLRKCLAFLNIYRLILIAVITDFLVFDAALLLAARLYISETWHGIPPESYPVVLTIPALLQITIGFITGAYRKESISVLRILYSVFLGFFIVSSVTFFFKQYAYSRAVIIFTYILLFMMFPLWRILMKVFLRLGLKEEYYKSRTLVVGVSDDALELARKLKSSVTSIHNIVGMIGPNRRSFGCKMDNFEVIGSLDNIKKIIREKKINEVIFSSGELTYNQMLSVVADCQGENIDFKVAGKDLNFLVGKSSITMLDDIPLLEITYNISLPSHRIGKYITEALISLPALILLYPFIYLLPKAVHRESDFSRFLKGLPGIITGKASLVGPANVNGNSLYLGKRGLTGLWYTEGVDLNDKDEVRKLDIFYAKNQSVWLDLEILGKTFSAMFNRLKV